MLKSFRDSWLKNYYLNDERHKKIPAQISDSLFRKLQLIDDAVCDQDLRRPPSNHFERLRGNLVGKHSIRVNKQWRLVFVWDEDNGDASNIYLDPHNYKNHK